MSAAMMLASCGGTKDAGKTDQALIGKSDIKIEGKRMTPEALWAMGRIGGLAVSPDGKQIAYTVAYYSVPENREQPGSFCDERRMERIIDRLPTLLIRKMK